MFELSNIKPIRKEFKRILIKKKKIGTCLILFCLFGKILSFLSLKTGCLEGREGLFCMQDMFCTSNFSLKPVDATYWSQKGKMVMKTLLRVQKLTKDFV